MLTRVITDAIAEGLKARSAQAAQLADTASASPTAEQPLADWEKELLGAQPGSESTGA